MMRAVHRLKVITAVRAEFADGLGQPFLLLERVGHVGHGRLGGLQPLAVQRMVLRLEGALMPGSGEAAVGGREAGHDGGGGCVGDDFADVHATSVWLGVAPAGVLAGFCPDRQILKGWPSG